MESKQYVRVRVRTDARKEQVENVQKDLWKIDVREKAERGVANARVRELLAKEIGCRKEKLHLIKGATRQSKTYLLTN